MPVINSLKPGHYFSNFNFKLTKNHIQYWLDFFFCEINFNKSITETARFNIKIISRMEYGLLHLSE